MKILPLAILLCSIAAPAQRYTRGIGVYPGDPKDYMGPTLRVDTNTYRNLALHRPAYQSSAYDYNLTAQLVTDGITEVKTPQWIETWTSDGGVLGKIDREVFLDGNPVTSIEVRGETPWVQFEVHGGDAVPEIDRLDLYLSKIYSPAPATGWLYTVLGSDDLKTWLEVGRASGSAWPDMKGPGSESTPSFKQTIRFREAAHYRAYRIELAAAGITKWGVAEAVPFDRGEEIHLAGPEHFSSAWMSAGSGEEWVSVDLGSGCNFDRIKLAWIDRAAAGSVQTSLDSRTWQTLQQLPVNAAGDDIHLAKPARGRWVRVVMTRPETEGHGYILSEVEVYGRGGPVVISKPQGIATANGTLALAGGDWRVQRASLVAAGGEQISSSGFADRDWMVATVPGTVLTSYLNDEAIPDPDFGDNQYLISDSFFCADFWYRDEFVSPGKGAPGQHYWLNFDGINWKAEVYLNGHTVGRIDGAFMRGKFDVTGLVKPGQSNAMAVRIIRNSNPGSTKDKEGRNLNGGALGRDNPTFHASIGWDWISTIRGRDIGIWNDVTLTTTGPVTIEDPLVTTSLPLPDTTHADVTIAATLHNEEAQAITGILRAGFGEVAVEMPVALKAGATDTFQFAPETQPALRLTNPRLWWPTGYGEPNLYPVSVSFIADGKTTDTKTFQAGIRQFTYSEDGGVLKIWVNGRRFIAHGGNWGFSESMLRYRAREYETAMRYHRDEHFNMVRDWVGQIGDESFYEAADRNGVVVWQDFWLANPWDGPNPDDNVLFLKNAQDYLLRIRNHPSLGLFCGRNEGFPPKPIDDGLRSMVAGLRPGSYYISSSADGPVSGHGPYRVEPLKEYFAKAPEKFHSEMGSPNVAGMDSLRRTVPASALWPQAEQWLLHDFYPDNPFRDAVEQEYGGATNIEDWVSLAQFVNYNAYRGMFEGQSKNRLGLLIWMSHPAWPSLLWQTYDYFFDTDGGYFGAKKASEPLHIQWNAASDAVEVVNSSAGDQSALTAHAEVLDIDGSVKWEKGSVLNSREDSTESPMKLEFPPGLARTHFIRLKLEKDGRLLSSNFYLHGNAEEDYQGIRTLGKAKVTAKTHANRNGTRWEIRTELHNESRVPALMVQVKAVREKTRDPIEPGIYDDNYIALMPGERRTITIELLDADTRGERPRVLLEGYNLSR